MSVRSVMRHVASLFFVIFAFAVCPVQALQRVVYMNGINTTTPEVVATRNKIDVILGNSLGHIPDKRTFDVAYKWNSIGWYGTTSWTESELSQDLKELFIQKVYEERIFDAYKSMLSYIQNG